MDAQLAERLITVALAIQQEWEEVSQSVPPFEQRCTEKMIRVMLQVETLESLILRKALWSRNIEDYNDVPQRLITLRVMANLVLDPGGEPVGPCMRPIDLPKE